MKRKKFISIFLILCCNIMFGNPASANILTTSSTTQQTSNTTRLSGQTRYETAKVISEYYNQGTVQNVILSTGIDFADALSASVLAHQKDAPFLLVDTTIDGSSDAFDYIIKHLNPNGTVYLIGGTGIIGKEFETKLNTLGFQNIIRIAGNDRYDTSYQLACSLDATSIPTVVISSGEQYPDALSVSSFAANKGWPILLTMQNTLPDKMKEFLLDEKPSKVYITGGTGVISDNVVAEITVLLPQAQIKRLAGSSRFETNAIISETFSQAPSNLFLATGYGFADTLAGCVLAAKAGDPIVFIDSNTTIVPSSVAGYLTTLHSNKVSPNLITFGGSSVVPDAVIKNVTNLLSGIEQEDTTPAVGANPTPSVANSGTHTYKKTYKGRIGSEVYYYIDDKQVASVTDPISPRAIYYGNGWQLHTTAYSHRVANLPYSNVPQYEYTIYPDVLYFNGKEYNIKANDWHNEPTLTSEQQLEIEYILNDINEHNH